MTHKENIYTIDQISPNQWRIGNSGVYMDLITGSHHALLFDTGYGFGDVHGLIRSITELPLYVVNSHGHVDHACGNWQFEAVYIHPKDMELCRAHNGPEMRQAELPSCQVPVDFNLEEYLTHDAGKLIPAGEGQRFELGGITLEVVHLPGHTAGSIGLFSRELQVLYVGDAINCFVWLFLPEATGLDTYVRSLHRAAALPWSHMIQSHEPRPVPKRRLWDYLELAENLDFEAGYPVQAPLGCQAQTRICTRHGVHYDDRSHPGFAAIMIAREKL